MFDTGFQDEVAEGVFLDGRKQLGDQLAGVVLRLLIRPFCVEIGLKRIVLSYICLVLSRFLVKFSVKMGLACLVDKGFDELCVKPPADVMLHREFVFDRGSVELVSFLADGFDEPSAAHLVSEPFFPQILYQLEFFGGLIATRTAFKENPGSGRVVES